MTPHTARINAINDAAAIIPTSWLDPRLSGPQQVLGKPPWGCPDIERLLQRLRCDIIALAPKTRPVSARKGSPVRRVSKSKSVTTT